MTNGATADVTIYWGDSDGGTSPGAWDTAVSLGSHDVVHVIPNLGDGTFGAPVQHVVAGIGEEEEVATLTAAVSNMSRSL